MKSKLLNVGFGNTVVASRVVAIVTPSSAPMKRLKGGAKEGGKLIDATQGRKTRCRQKPLPSDLREKKTPK